MKAEIKTILFSGLGGLAGFLSWLSTVPPEQQSGWLATLVDITPVEYRPNVALFSRFLTLGMGMYVAYRATHNSPQKPNP